MSGTIIKICGLSSPETLLATIAAGADMTGFRVPRKKSIDLFADRLQHRLINPGKIDLELLEVQTGFYLGEDDIIRFQDVYNRG